MTTFLLIRHGLTDAVGKVMAGHSAGVHLNATGRDQAASLPARLGQLPIAAIYASPLERTRETAQAIADARGVPVEIERRFIEVDFGRWTNRRFADLADDSHWQLYNAFRGVTRPPDGEALVDVQQRTAEALFDLHARHPDHVVAIVSHADTLRAILMYFLGMPIDFVQRLDLSPGRISVLQLGHGAPRVLQVNGFSVPEYDG
ncbi:MAG TPA: histidine phosphatase family protein [Vicinamibacterales bacterium]|nr:histidine phosphatase family protein [Vicinamibacterales bacterium]